MTSIRPVVVAVLVAGLLLAGCRTGADDAAPPLAPDASPTGPSTADTSTIVTSPVTPSTPPVDSTAPPASLDGVTGELIITRQRDLIGRGFINVLTTNESGHPLLITDHALVADDFAGVPAPVRLVNVPDGRAIAIQVPYGVADDCTSEAPVTATLSFTWTTPTDVTPHAAGIALDGTDILDRIRAEQCAGQALAAEADLSFDDVSIVDGTVHADLVITRTGGASDFTFASPIGTVLVDVRNADDKEAVSLAPSDASVTIPLTFVVNRCDPHALAEVTKRFGLDLPMSIDGAAPQPVTIPLTPLLDDLETIVQECFDATDG